MEGGKRLESQYHQIPILDVLKCQNISSPFLLLFVRLTYPQLPVILGPLRITPPAPIIVRQRLRIRYSLPTTSDLIAAGVAPHRPAQVALQSEVTQTLLQRVVI